MSIRINLDKCVGCLQCIEVCPGSLIKEKDTKAFMKYPKDCWGCVSCVKECKAGAIEFYLGADIGGNGGKMNVSYEGDIIHWNITKSDGTVKVIDVNSKDSNKY
jgi:adenylylsulfate reductase subunit B